MQVVEVNPEGTEHEDVDWTCLAYEQIWKCACVNMVKKFVVPHLEDRIYKYAGIILTKQYFIHENITGR